MNEISDCRVRALAAAALALCGALAGREAIAQPATLQGSRVTVEKIAPGGLGAAIGRLGAGTGARWIGWALPAQDPRRRMCCFGTDEGRRIRRSSPTESCCSLEHENSFSMSDDEDSHRLAEPDDFFVFARFREGHAERVRSFSADCGVAAGDSPVVWLDGVTPGESVAWLEALARRRADPEGGSRGGDDEDEGDGASDRVTAPAIAAIALTAGSDAQAALDRLVAPGEPPGLRKKTSFWLAAARGSAGCRRLTAIVPGDSDPGFRKHGTFALSLCHDDAEATRALIGLARRDESAKVRSQALFWLAQSAGRKVSETLDDAIRNDPDTEVKKQAVFAFSQMPDGEGVPELIRVARTNRNPEVRERAVFWLGQSKDPRALDFIEKVLTSP